MPEYHVDLSTVNPKFYQKLTRLIQETEELEENTGRYICVETETVPPALEPFVDRLINVGGVAPRVILKPEFEAVLIGRSFTETIDNVWFFIDKPHDSEFEEVYFVHTLQSLMDGQILEQFTEIDFEEIDFVVLQEYYKTVAQAATVQAISGLGEN